ncbi:hypothetical protein [Brevundimonas sp. NIBR11]|uniref:hypothetical protein n=1 Tax=Brevundimonas sp. NIBR11 TaxID=3015999 RepID=UPI0022F0FEBF|nr:hypothetical protein [Brevundimonas sp. NIBR11]WGM31540.1 hypothetical protein KKHFBJBL_01787 [Brevundimonas sp. NIBR11]
MRFFKVVLAHEGQTREVRVPSLTGVQAGDAAASLARPGEAIQSIEEVEDDGLQQVDGPPPKSQAAELASVTPGAAAAPAPPETR